MENNVVKIAENPETKQLEQCLTEYAQQDEKLAKDLNKEIEKYDKFQEKHEEDLEKLEEKYADKPEKYEEKLDKLNEKYEKEEDKYEEKLEKLQDKHDVPDCSTEEPENPTPQPFTSSSGTTEQQNLVNQALERHAQELGATFAEDSDWEAFLKDIYGDNIDSNLDLAALRDRFVSGDLRPQVRFVPQAALTDPRGESRNVAFAASLQTLLLSEDITEGDIEQAVLDDIGHWWDTQLSSQDTVDADGDPFDEGFAYAERFAEGTEGDNFYENAAFLNDRFTIVLDGESIDIEFQPTDPARYAPANITYLNNIFPGSGQNPPLTLEPDGANDFFTDKDKAEQAIERLVDNNNFVFARIIANGQDGIPNDNTVRYEIGYTDLGKSQHSAWEDDSSLKDHLKENAKKLITLGATEDTTSEAAGEIATAIAVVEKYDNAKLKVYKGVPTSTDQVWENETGGNSTLIIAEAKGGGSELTTGSSNSFNGQQIDNQMSPEWVIDRLGRKDKNSMTETELIETYGIFKKLVNTRDGNNALNNQPKFVINGLKNNDNLNIEGLVIQAQAGSNTFYSNQTDDITLNSGDDVELEDNGAVDYKPLITNNLPAQPALVNINDPVISQVFAEWSQVQEFKDLIQEVTDGGGITIRTTSGEKLNAGDTPINEIPFSENVTAYWNPTTRAINLKFNTSDLRLAGVYEEGLSNLLFELHNAKYDAEYKNLYDLAVGVKTPGFTSAEAFAEAVIAVETQAAADWAALAGGNNPLLKPVKPERSSSNVDPQLPDLFTEDAIEDASFNYYEEWFEENQGDRNAVRFDVNKPDTEPLVEEFGGETDGDTGIDPSIPKDSGEIKDGGDESVKSTFFTINDAGTGVKELNPDADIDPNLPTYFITHGFTDGVNNGEKWQQKMGNAILQQQNANVILVDWDAPGFDPNISISNLTAVSLTNYERSARNTEVVGKKIAEFINNSKINPARTTLIGHSLGAQVSGWAGTRFNKLQPNQKINNIIGLDPARPGFQESLNSEFYNIPVNVLGNGLLGNYVSSHKLSADDANRVTAIHTSQRFGVTEPITGAEGTENDNTLDVYINGGSYFRGVSSVLDPIGNRSHNFSHQFFQYLLEGEGFDKDRNQVADSKPLSSLNNPIKDSFINNFSGEKLPLVSLNTVLQGSASGNSTNTNRGIVDITISGSNRSAQVAQIPDSLGFQSTGGNDIVAGTKGRDEIVGGAGNETLVGLQGNDALFANEGNDLLFGGTGNDILRADAGNDTLVGDIGDDTLNGDSGTDILFGGKGNDQLFGGNELVVEDDGGDRLIGVDPLDANPGIGEIDTLAGALGASADVYVLGDSRTNYYVNLQGDQTPSYAIIEDFQLGTDLIEINSATQLVFRPVGDFGITPPENGGIGLAVGTQGNPELIAVVQPPQDAPFSLIDLENSAESFVRV